MKTRIWIAILVAIFGICSVTASEFPKRSASEGFFKSLDKDADGDVDADELRKVLRDVGGEHFDESHEIESGVAHVLGQDKDKDRGLLHNKLVSQWMSFALLMSPDMVADWLEHAAGLTHATAQRAKDAKWTGVDLPRLLSREADAFLRESRMSLDRADRLKLLGAVKLRMLNVGAVPSVPELRLLDSSKNARCGTVLLSWVSSSRSFPETHKYRLFRRLARDDNLSENPWIVVYEGRSTAYTDRIKEVKQRYDYKLEAWNVIGPSNGFELHDVVPSRRGCDAADWLFEAFSFLNDLSGYAVNILGVLSFILFYLKSNQARPSPIPRERVTRPVVGPNGATLIHGSYIQANGQQPRYTVSDLISDDSLSDALRVLPDPIPFANLDSLDERGSLTRSVSRRHYSIDRCSECQRPVTRATRHHCGSCMRVFCTKHTAIHPHLDAKVPFMGTVILSTCGIDSKCRCYTCSGFPRPTSPTDRSNSPIKKTSTKRLWDVVKKDILVRKTVKAWRRKESVDDDPAETTMQEKSRDQSEQQ